GASATTEQISEQSDIRRGIPSLPTNLVNLYRRKSRASAVMRLSHGGPLGETSMIANNPNAPPPTDMDVTVKPLKRERLRHLIFTSKLNLTADESATFEESHWGILEEYMLHLDEN